jgi:hypothetical protein
MTYCRKCKSEGIKKQATYGPKGGKPSHCAKHGKEEDGYINVSSKRCEDVECNELAYYGVEGTTVRTHCQNHGKELGYIDVVSNRCKDAECNEYATYGIDGTRKTTHCPKHGKLLGYIDVASKRCEDVECNKFATFGDLVEKTKRFCTDHKLEGMIDVANKRCEDAECNGFAYYGDPVEKTKRFCADHQLEGMINVARKLCERDGCITFATYGDPVEKTKRFCVDHKLAGMIDVASKRCEHDGCITRPSYGIVKNRPTHCADHKNDNMSDVIHNQCASCKLTIVKRNGDYCAVCDEFDKNDGASHKTRSKERAVIHALLENDIPNVDYVRVYDVQYNKSIGKACGSYRPDILIDCGNFMIIIEVDEFQHRPQYVTNITREIDDDGIERLTKRARVVSQYEGSCELTRMINIRFAAGVPCYVIRFNPDAFKINGVPGRVSIEARHAELCRQIKSMMTKPPRSDLVVTYMYYDDAILATEDVVLPPGYVWTI